MALDMTAIVLTYNEEIDLPDCLESLKDLDCQVIVIDSGSDDGTVEIAKRAGAQVVRHEFENALHILSQLC